MHTRIHGRAVCRRPIAAPEGVFELASGARMPVFCLVQGAKIDDLAAEFNLSDLLRRGLKSGIPRFCGAVRLAPACDKRESSSCTVAECRKSRNVQKYFTDAGRKNNLRSAAKRLSLLEQAENLVCTVRRVADG